ncbi:MAG: ParB N-terminal domain-containing protein [Brevinematales bacterium]|nr:ParB N-terminal domain-containing protein [Brevinematales bacterium]
MVVKIKDIRVGKRVRKDIGDLSNLKKSIKKHGILNPILLTGDNELIAGYRRLTAARELGLEEVEAKIVDPRDNIEFLEMEMEENMIRKDFSQDELLDGMKKKKSLVSPNIFQRIWNFIKRIFGIR